MILRRILPLTAAVLLAAGCNAGDLTQSSPISEAAGQRGVNMGGSGGYTAPGAPRMDGSQMGGSGGYTGGSGTPTSTNSTGSPMPGDSTTLAERGSQMGGSGG